MRVFPFKNQPSTIKSFNFPKFVYCIRTLQSITLFSGDWMLSSGLCNCLTSSLANAQISPTSSNILSANANGSIEATLRSLPWTPFEEIKIILNPITIKPTNKKIRWNILTSVVSCSWFTLHDFPHFSVKQISKICTVESANVRVKSIYNTNLMRSSCRAGQPACTDGFSLLSR